MFINRLELKNFRNYSELNLEFASDKILFTGANAQGKTNILEAVYYLSALESFRAKSDSELIKRSESFCSLKAEIKKTDIDTGLEVLINPPNRKKLKINGIVKNKMSEFISCLSSVCFTSSDLLLLRGAPDDRRKWLDAAICGIYPAYIERLNKYSRIKQQKNNYLKSLKGNINADSGLLDIYNEQLAKTGSNIIFIRVNFLHELQKTASIKHKQISKDENLVIMYDSAVTGSISALNKYEFNTEYIYSRFLKCLEEKRAEEIIRAQSVIGAHRDDVSYFINDIDAEKFASQGQQRTIVLSLKLAELELIKDKTGAEAVLLLDDVLAELDASRQNFLLEAIEGAQTIITAADIHQFRGEYLKNAEIYEIKDNSAYKC